MQQLLAEHRRKVTYPLRHLGNLRKVQASRGSEVAELELVIEQQGQVEKSITSRSMLEPWLPLVQQQQLAIVVQRA